MRPLEMVAQQSWKYTWHLTHNSTSRNISCKLAHGHKDVCTRLSVAICSGESLQAPQYPWMRNWFTKQTISTRHYHIKKKTGRSPYAPMWTLSEISCSVKVTRHRNSVYSLLISVRKTRGKKIWEFPVWLSRLRTWHSVREDVGLIPGLAPWVKDPAFATSCCGCGIDQIWPLAWELPYASGVALKRKCFHLSPHRTLLKSNQKKSQWGTEGQGQKGDRLSLL